MTGRTATLGSTSPERVGVQLLATLLRKERRVSEAGMRGVANGSLGLAVGRQPATRTMISGPLPKMESPSLSRSQWQAQI